MKKRILSVIPSLLLSALVLAGVSPSALAADDNPNGTTLPSLALGDSMTVNSGTITNNYGTVDTNDVGAEITNNFGAVSVNNGVVANNFGGSVTSGAPPVNEYYRVTFTDQSHINVTGLTAMNGASWATADAHIGITAKDGYTLNAVNTTASVNVSDSSYSVAADTNFDVAVTRDVQSVTLSVIWRPSSPTADVYARLTSSVGGGAATPVLTNADGVSLGDSNGWFALKSADNYSKTFEKLYTHSESSQPITYAIEEASSLGPLHTAVANGGGLLLGTKYYAVSYSGTTATNRSSTLVTLDRNGGSGGTAFFNAVAGESCPTTLTQPTKANYIFSGYCSSDGAFTLPLTQPVSYPANVTGYTDQNGKWIYPQSSLTLTAQWQELAARVTFSDSSTLDCPSFALAWDSAGGNAGSTVTLYKDVVAGTANAPESWPITGADVTLDLNGHKIDRQLTAAAAVSDGSVIIAGSSFTLKDSAGGGMITGGNTTGDGGGILCGSSTGVKLLGGKISGNKAEGSGGGVYIQKDTAVGGALEVTGNTSGGSASNLYIDNTDPCVLQIASALTGSIGVSSKTAPTAAVPVTVTGVNSADYSRYFTADMLSYNIYNVSNQLKLRVAPQTAVTLDKQGGTGGSASFTATFGRPAPTDLTMPGRTNFTLDGYCSAAPASLKVMDADGALIAGVTGFTDENANWATEAATVTLYAKWSPVVYTIAYKDEGGANLSGTLPNSAPDRHTYGADTDLVNPTKQGYRFAGWYDNSTCTGTALTTLAGDGYSSNITLYAKWSPLAYNIAYRDQNNADFTGDFADGAPIAHVYGTDTTLVSPTRERYDFVGWYDNSACNGNAITTLSGTGYTADITLYAKWTYAQYTITYKDRGGTAFTGTHAANHPTAHTYGSATDLASASKTGYTFGGWYESSDCSDTAITSLAADGYTDDITLYAKWTAKVYSITYKNQKGATFNGTHGANYPTTHTYGRITRLVSPTRTNYTFGGWYTDSNCTGTAVTNLTATGYTADITLYAKWTYSYVPSYSRGTAAAAKKYNIVYKDKDGKDFTGVNPVGSAKTYSPGKATVLPEPIRSGYVFDGWFTEKACTGSPIKSIPDKGKTGDITLYARWLEETYVISYRDKGGSAFSGELPDSAPAKHTYGKETKLSPATREGYTFGGWYTAMDCTGDPLTALKADSVTTDVLLYAKWTSLDAGLTGVKVFGESARLAGSNLTVSLPEGSDLPTDPSFIEIDAEGAKVSEPETADNGETWTFSVTSPNGVKRDYVLKVSVRVPAEGLDKADEESEKRIRVWPFIVGAGVLAAAGGGAWYFFYYRRKHEYN